MQWLTGTGPRNQYFTGNDPFTRQLEQDYQIKVDNAEVAQEFKSGGVSLNSQLTAPNGGTFDNQLGGFDGVGKYAYDVVTGNWAATYLGSYQVTITPIEICSNHSAIVRYQVYNESTLSSATHPSFYTELQDAGIPVAQFGTWEDTLPGKTGPLSKTTQTITWTSQINY